MHKTPDPDEFNRLRVRDKDTGHEFSIHAEALPHGNFTVLNEDASDAGGYPLPVKHHHKSAVETTTSGQSADPSKEK